MNNPRIPSALRAVASAINGAFPQHASEQTSADRNDEAAPDTAPDTAPDAVLDRLPTLLRIQSLTRVLDGNVILNRAVLCHRRATLCVGWTTIGHVQREIAVTLP